MSGIRYPEGEMWGYRSTPKPALWFGLKSAMQRLNGGREPTEDEIRKFAIKERKLWQGGR